MWFRFIGVSTVVDLIRKRTIEVDRQTATDLGSYVLLGAIARRVWIAINARLGTIKKMRCSTPQRSKFNVFRTKCDEANKKSLGFASIGREVNDSFVMGHPGHSPKGNPMPEKSTCARLKLENHDGAWGT